jgi:peptidoglycan lytic transglycosylase
MKIFKTRLVLLAFLIICTCPLFLLSESSAGKTSEVRSKPKKIQFGKASYYCKKFHGKKTACGRVYNRHELVAAHATFPFYTLVLVTNLENGRQVKVRIVDRGPSKSHRARGIIIDLSRGAAEKIHMVKKGRALVKLEVLEWGKSKKILGETNGEPDSYS